MKVDLEKTSMSINNKSVLLYSGGMDSYMISKIEKFDILLYIDSNSVYSKIEIDFLRDQNIPNLVIDTRLDLGDVEFTDSIVPLRNLHFINIASYYGDRIVLGALSGDRITDKNRTFAGMAQDLLNYIYQPSWWSEGRTINVDLAYKDYSKKGLIDLYISKGGTIDDLIKYSYSCYTPVDNKPCGVCKSCCRRWIALLHYRDTSSIYNSDPAKIWKDNIKIVKSTLNDPVKFRGDEDLDAIEAWDKNYNGVYK